MPLSYDQIRPLAPGASLVEKEIVNEALSSANGSVEVVTEHGRSLGKTDYRADAEARVVVHLAGISKGSGGEMYGITSIHTSSADHYHISELPEIVAVPVD